MNNDELVRAISDLRKKVEEEKWNEIVKEASEEVEKRKNELVKELGSEEAAYKKMIEESKNNK